MVQGIISEPKPFDDIDVQASWKLKVLQITLKHKVQFYLPRDLLESRHNHLKLNFKMLVFVDQ